jgi:hypothetical protein
MTRKPAIDRALAAIEEDAWTPVSYPSAVRDPDTGAWISCQGRRNRLRRFRIHQGPDHRPPGGAPGQGRPLPRRVVPGLAYHPFFTNTDAPAEQADITHRRHVIIETVFSDLIDGPLAHIPSGRFGANSAWVLCAAIAHNLVRAAGVPTGDQHTRARGSTLRRKILPITRC